MLAQKHFVSHINTLFCRSGDFGEWIISDETTICIHFVWYCDIKPLIDWNFIVDTIGDHNHRIY
jgi:hypothetical protein